MLNDKQAQHKGNAKLQEHEVRDIRNKLKLYRAGDLAGRPPRFLANFYNMTTEAIRKIERREVWSHLPDEPPLTPEEEKAAGEALAKRMLELQKGLDSGEIPYTEASPGLSATERMEQAMVEQRKKNKATDQDKMLEELADSTIDKVTGKPYSPAALQRMKDYGGR